MPRPWMVLLGAGLTVGVIGCTESVVCPDAVPLERRDAGADLPVYVDTGDPYEDGRFAVNTYFLDSCQLAAPVPMRLHVPQDLDVFATIVFLHGWKTPPSAYDTMLRHLASRGYVVVTPQMVGDCTGFILGEPSLEGQAEIAAAVLDWAPQRLSQAVGVTANTKRLGLAGHSLGAKVAWLLMQRTDTPVAVAVVDPVDATVIPLGNGDAITAQPAPFAVPTLVLGAGISGLCSFDGGNHWDFFDALSAPAWHVVATDHGHQDMLDEDDGVLARQLCGTGPDREGMRRLAGGALAAFFRAQLQEDAGAYRYITDPSRAPVAVDLESR